MRLTWTSLGQIDQRHRCPAACLTAVRAWSSTPLQALDPQHPHLLPPCLAHTQVETTKKKKKKTYSASLEIAAILLAPCGTTRTIIHMGPLPATIQTLQISPVWLRQLPVRLLDARSSDCQHGQLTPAKFRIVPPLLPPRHPPPHMARQSISASAT